MSNHRVAQTFLELADTLVERFDGIEFLHVLAERCVDLLGVDSAGILLADHQGVLRLVATSSDRVSSPEQVQSGGASRWAAVDAFPMRLRAEVIGSLKLFRTSPGALPPETATLAQSLANVATISLLQVRAVRQDHGVAEQLRTALAGRVAIEQAKGVLTEQLEIGVADAFALMRTYARNTGQLLSDIAEQVNARSPEIAGLTRVSKPRPCW
ncbi:ANTAR domain-containing protein [Lentzea sp. BCCO 10_0061]|uniref:ANTAR domain-containing protein n=1 Tax=Lentzea sokolovensis TaxID=3095429 RepID=A0ABU4UQW5_9PSEU|nr:ANTAR domain-containing protein [Lentzea sp. BCCO 10_0061]MDX8141877.1 ANTAR domain-containing protein [Lentzea sp. BCCO 10_0061]